MLPGRNSGFAEDKTGSIGILSVFLKGRVAWANLLVTHTAPGHQPPATEAVLTYGQSQRSSIPTETRNYGNSVQSWWGTEATL